MVFYVRMRGLFFSLCEAFRGSLRVLFLVEGLARPVLGFVDDQFPVFVFLVYIVRTYATLRMIYVSVFVDRYTR